MARKAGGEWLVRVEDLDPPREIPGAADDQLRTLERFGLVPDGTVLRQSDRDAHYREALERLLAGGDAFECHCSRSDLAGSGGVHRACVPGARRPDPARSEEHTSELQSLMRISYAVFCLKKKNTNNQI